MRKVIILEKHLHDLLRASRNYIKAQEQGMMGALGDPCHCPWLRKVAPLAVEPCEYCQTVATLDDFDAQGIA